MLYGISAVSASEFYLLFALPPLVTSLLGKVIYQHDMIYGVQASGVVLILCHSFVSCFETTYSCELTNSLLLKRRLVGFEMLFLHIQQTNYELLLRI